MLPGLAIPFNDRRHTLDVIADEDNLWLGASGDRLADLNHAIDLHIQIMPSIEVGAALAPGALSPLAAMRLALPDGSRIVLTNYGRIWGGGGIGGDGDRGRREPSPQESHFIGAGGGGGAGSSSQGGQYSRVDPDPDNEATDGEAAAEGSTTGGAGGYQRPGEAPAISDGGFVQGRAAQWGGDALVVTNDVDLFVENGAGEIWAGAPGGEGGYQFGSLTSNSTQDAEPGGNTPNTLTELLGSLTTDGVAIKLDSDTDATWRSGYAYPNIRGIVNQKP